MTDQQYTELRNIQEGLMNAALAALSRDTKTQLLVAIHRLDVVLGQVLDEVEDEDVEHAERELSASVRHADEAEDEDIERYWRFRAERAERALELVEQARTQQRIGDGELIEQSTAPRRMTVEELGPKRTKRSTWSGLTNSGPPAAQVPPATIELID